MKKILFTKTRVWGRRNEESSTVSSGINSRVVITIHFWRDKEGKLQVERGRGELCREAIFHGFQCRVKASLHWPCGKGGRKYMPQPHSALSFLSLDGIPHWWTQLEANRGPWNSLILSIQVSLLGYRAEWRRVESSLEGHSTVPVLSVGSQSQAISSECEFSISSNISYAGKLEIVG